jgi:methyltransferase (TIGR00027 family)
MASTPIENVSDTAFWVAHYRAVETQRPDALFRDPFAARLTGERGSRIATAMPMSRMTAWLMAIRTVIIDSYIRSAVQDGIDTVLNLGAGLDARPYRMDLPPSLHWIEADYPAMIEYKETVLAPDKPACRLERVKIDLSDEVKRRELFARVDVGASKVLVLTEGVIPYLTNDQVASLAADLHALEHVRYWIAEYHSPRVIKYRERSGLQRKLQNAPFQFKPDDWFGFFAQCGWRPKEIRYLAEEGERLHRPIALPFWAKVMGLGFWAFVSKQRQLEGKRFSAYVLLQPEPPVAK